MLAASIEGDRGVFDGNGPLSGVQGSAQVTHLKSKSRHMPDEEDYRSDFRSRSSSIGLSGKRGKGVGVEIKRLDAHLAQPVCARRNGTRTEQEDRIGNGERRAVRFMGRMDGQGTHIETHRQQVQRDTGYFNVHAFPGKGIGDAPLP